MSEHLIHLTTSNFKEKIKRGNWVVDFWAAWCGPCKILGPIFDETARENKGKINFGKVDVDAESEIAQEYDVMSIPTIIFFKNGEVVDRTVGVLEKEEIIEKAEESF